MILNGVLLVQEMSCASAMRGAVIVELNEETVVVGSGA